MNTKIIALLILFHFYATTMNMEVVPQYKFDITLFKVLPHDVKQEIGHYIAPQWWYLQQTFQHGDYVLSACFDSSGKRLATASSDWKARIFDIETKKEIISFPHDASVNSACFDSSSKLLATASNDGKARIFAQHTSYTLEQIILKCFLLNWLLIEKPAKNINNLTMLLADVAHKNDFTYDGLLEIWKTFPVDMQDAMWRTMQHRIQKIWQTTIF